MMMMMMMMQSGVKWVALVKHWCSWVSHRTSGEPPADLAATWSGSGACVCVRVRVCVCVCVHACVRAARRVSSPPTGDSGFSSRLHLVSPAAALSSASVRAAAAGSGSGPGLGSGSGSGSGSGPGPGSGSGWPPTLPPWGTSRAGSEYARPSQTSSTCPSWWEAAAAGRVQNRLCVASFLDSVSIVVWYPF